MSALLRPDARRGELIAAGAVALYAIDAFGALFGPQRRCSRRR